MFSRSVLAIATITVGGCSDDCSNRVLSAQWSPNNSHQAAVFQRNCGATTGYSYHVAIIERGSDTLSKGNVLILDSDHGASSNPIPTIRWQGDDAIEVAIPKRARIFAQAQTVSGISINYRTR
jgi:hypothetical protein